MAYGRVAFCLSYFMVKSWNYFNIFIDVALNKVANDYLKNNSGQAKTILDISRFK